jgi:hypothetical protein
MTKIDLNRLAEKLALCMQEIDLYTYMDGLLGFYHAKPEEFLVRCMTLENQIGRYELDARAKLLDGVTLFYMSESKSQTEVGWVDKAHCLNQFFTEETMSETMDWAIVCNAISYQCNVAGKCVRMAKQFASVANRLEDFRKNRKAMLWAAEAMLYHLADHMMDNVQVVRATLEERDVLSDLSLWYSSYGRERMLDTESEIKKGEEDFAKMFWLVPKIDTFLQGEISVQETYLNPMVGVKGFPRPKKAWQQNKEVHEWKIREHAIKMLLEDLRTANLMLKESHDQQGNESAIQAGES